MRRVVIVQVIDTHFHHNDAVKNMYEASLLVTTCGGVVVEKIAQHRVNPHPATYIGPGKVSELAEIVKAKRIDIVVMNDVLKASVLFRVEKILWTANPHIEVWDRVDLILHIFDQHAHTAEAKLQIELARLNHTGPRIYGLGRTVLSRQGGGIGQRGGFGETNIEFERRQIKDRTLKIRKQLRHLAEHKQARVQYRKERGFGPVALVGYTSAGKTTLFNRLTGKDKPTEANLFTTLDTVVGKLKTADHQLPILISDTIGFIQDLPPNLIEAFRSTLVESLEAKLILHVIDITDPLKDQKIETVEHILKELHVSQPVVRVYNKIDKQHQVLDGEVLISAKTGEGIDQLKHCLRERLLGELNNPRGDKMGDKENDRQHQENMHKTAG